jgi:hypothetical protein
MLIPMQKLDVITAKAKQFKVDINSDDEADEGGDGETESATFSALLSVSVLHVSR